MDITKLHVLPILLQTCLPRLVQASDGDEGGNSRDISIAITVSVFAVIALVVAALACVWLKACSNEQEDGHKLDDLGEQGHIQNIRKLRDELEKKGCKRGKGFGKFSVKYKKMPTVSAKELEEESAIEEEGSEEERQQVEIIQMDMSPRRPRLTSDSRQPFDALSLAASFRSASGSGSYASPYGAVKSYKIKKSRVGETAPLIEKPQLKSKSSKAPSSVTGYLRADDALSWGSYRSASGSGSYEVPHSALPAQHESDRNNRAYFRPWFVKAVDTYGLNIRGRSDAIRVLKLRGKKVPSDFALPAPTIQSESSAKHSTAADQQPLSGTSPSRPASTQGSGPSSSPSGSTVHQLRYGLNSRGRSDAIRVLKLPAKKVPSDFVSRAPTIQLESSAKHSTPADQQPLSGTSPSRPASTEGSGPPSSPSGSTVHQLRSIGSLVFSKQPIAGSSHSNK